MDYNDLKKIAEIGGLVKVGGYCCDNRHGSPPDYYVKPIYHADHPEYGECVILDESVYLIFKVGESIYDHNAECGACCITTLESVDMKYFDDTLQGVLTSYKEMGLSFDEIVERIRMMWVIK